MQIQMRYYFTPSRLAKIESLTRADVGKDVVRQDVLYKCWWQEHKLATEQLSSTSLGNSVPATLACCSKVYNPEMGSDDHKDVPHSPAYNRKVIETTQKPISRGTNK